MGKYFTQIIGKQGLSRHASEFRGRHLCQVTSSQLIKALISLFEQDFKLFE